MTQTRTRWAAIGAAVAVTLGGGGVALVSATTPADAVTFVPITPCRVIDTRPNFQVGPRSAPLGPNDTHTVGTVGDAGQCTQVPADATAVSLNVTALDATEGTFLTIWATGETRPNASSLNPAPNQPPTPNAVTTSLSAAGEFSIFNLLGDVHVLADINGYYIDHDHDDRYYTQPQVDEAIAAATADPPWVIGINATDLIGSNATQYTSLGGPQGLTGLAFDPDQVGTSFYGFRLPNHYVAGTDVEIEVAMGATGGFGAPTFPCASIWRLGPIRAGQFEASVHDPSFAWEIEAGSSDFTNVQWSQRQFDTRSLDGAVATIEGDLLQPGDYITGTLLRFGSSLDDTCRGMMVVGVTARAAT